MRDGQDREEEVARFLAEEISELARRTEETLEHIHQIQLREGQQERRETHDRNLRILTVTIADLRRLLRTDDEDVTANDDEERAARPYDPAAAIRDDTRRIRARAEMATTTRHMYTCIRCMGD